MDRLLPGQSLRVGDSLTSPNKQSTLILQADGNLVLYRAGNRARWATNTDGRQVEILEMQGDGNLVMYGPGRSYVWDTATDAHYGAWFILQDDGNLVVYDTDGRPLWSSDTWIRLHSVGFKPSVNGFHFSNNDFPDCPLFKLTQPIPFGKISIPIGNASKGVCGGMVFAARDLFENNMLPPATKESPCNDSLYRYLVDRLIASFNLPGGIATYMFLMNPELSDHETTASKIGITPRGRAWRMIKQEWPVIKNKLDNNQLVPLALILKKSLNPFDLGENHVVLVYGYELDGTFLSLNVYDPNFPDENNARISFSLARPENTTEVFRSHGSKRIWCFFQPSYSRSRPNFLTATGSLVADH
ncbi:hypothetical protein [Chitinophaga qingshengii]|uniref:Bulb-type lectin domain-containing protein n=1 Tax=Chitinophaga qingshengii TaxID=1569794 RepID=A0ABR7TQK4_9BACT|nr:hypothetical protein [Chitinophaga qingshengii]MBC9932747.1 hypothetical protein [Chitinophaga qingshengii]